ncbi:hypothetical protein MMC22_011461 [Lobaria immixta]|nr:hypothetical protein [Lobaria immixta]
MFTARSLPRFQLQRRLYSSNYNSAASRFNSRPASTVRRVLVFAAVSIFFTSAGFLIAASPAIAPVIAMMSAPTDNETLALYRPDDDFASKIDSSIVNHPLAQSLRANPAYKESRPYLRIPEIQRKHSLTAGTLMGPGRVPVPPLAFVEEGKKLVSIAYLSTDLCGHVGMVHGGMLATMLDEGMARCCFAALPNKIGFTASLTVNYRAPSPAGSFVVLKAEVVKAEGRKAWVKGRIELLGDGIEPGKLLADGESLFIEPKYAKAMPKLLTVQQ